MESTGVCSKIHVSQSTVDLIIASGKGHWVTKRDDEIDVKGKGMMQTYWIEPQTKSNESQQSSSQASDEPVLDDKKQRLVNWNVDILSRSLYRIIAQRETRRPTTDRSDSKIEPQGFTLDEVKEIIELPAYDIEAMLEMKDPNTIELDVDLVNNLRGYVTAIAVSTAAAQIMRQRETHYVSPCHFPVKPRRACTIPPTAFTTLSMRPMSPCPCPSS
jgi:hypothetical protein